MKANNFINKVFYLYYDGFRRMTLGRTLWAIVLIKFFIIFFVLRLFFFPNFLKQNAPKGHEADYVSKEFVERSTLK